MASTLLYKADPQNLCTSYGLLPPSLPHAEQAADAGRDVREPGQPEGHGDEDVRAEPAGQGLLQRHHDDAATAPPPTAATAALHQRTRSTAAARIIQGRIKHFEMVLLLGSFSGCPTDPREMGRN